MNNRLIKVVVPTKEEFNRLNDFGIDVEAPITRAFIEELHKELIKLND